LLLLDLNLFGSDGFELLQHVLASAFQTIVISANTDRAVEAFEYGVLDFVAKPFNRERLTKAIERFTNKEVKHDNKTRYLAVRTSTGLKLLRLSDISYIQASNNYSSLKLFNGREYLHDKSLSALQQILPPNYFRVHKSYLIDVDNISNLTSLVGSRYQLTLNNGVTIPVGRSRITALRDKLDVKSH